MSSMRKNLRARFLVIARPARKVFILSCFAAAAALPAAAQSATAGADAGIRHDDAGNTNRATPPLKKPFVPLTGSQKLQRYLRSFYDPRVLFMTAASAGVGQAADSVPEWGQGAEGYGRRVANAYGKHVVKSSIRYGLDVIMGYDPRYWPSESTGFGRRLADAISQMFRTRDDTGRWRVAYPTFIANFGTGFIARAWSPPGRRGVSDAFESGAISFGVETGVKVLKEFVRYTR